MLLEVLSVLPNLFILSWYLELSITKPFTSSITHTLSINSYS